MFDEIKNFISNKYAIGALLISGKWGAGKTWTIKKLKKKYSLSPWWKFWNWRKFRLISLFGIKDVEQFKDTLKRKYSPTWYSLHKIIGFLGIAALIGIFPNLGTLVFKWLNVLEKDNLYYELFGLTGNIIFSFSALVLFISFHFFINKKVKKRKFFKKNILIFDDMERCDLPIITILGLINELVENDIKVIIIANEDKLPEDRIEDYKRFKEKVVFFTLKHNANDNINVVFDEIIKRFDTNYNIFLSKNKEIIVVSFKRFAEENIRALINALSMFENIFHLLSNSPLKHKERILINFLEIYYLVCQGHVVTKIYDNLPYGGLLSKYINSDGQELNEENQDSIIASRIESLCSERYFIRSLANWIETGYLDEKEFEGELNKIIDEQKPKEKITISNSEKILKGWSLEEIPDDELQNAYEEALTIAYKGNTNFDGFIRLMGVDNYLNSLKISHPPINWKMLNVGLSKYIDSIEINENFDDPHIQRHSYIAVENLEKHYCEDAKKLYQKIDEYNPTARRNRKEFIEALKSKDIDMIISASRRKIFNVFDDEMCDAFLERYKNARVPNEKKELANVWNEIFSSLQHHTKTFPETQNAIKKLKNGIENIQTTENSISQSINNLFIEDLESFIQ